MLFCKVLSPDGREVILDANSFLSPEWETALPLEGPIEASCWIEAKEAFGLSLTKTQERLLETLEDIRYAP